MDFFWVWRDFGVSFPVSLGNYVSFTPWLLYSSTPHSPEGFIHLKTGWAQGAWLQWSRELVFPSWHEPLQLCGLWFSSGLRSAALHSVPRAENKFIMPLGGPHFPMTHSARLMNVTLLKVWLCVSALHFSKGGLKILDRKDATFIGPIVFTGYYWLL